MEDPLRILAFSAWHPTHGDSLLAMNTLGNVTVLVGKNAAGKSLYLEGLAMMADVALGRQGGTPTSMIAFTMSVHVGGEIHDVYSMTVVGEPNKTHVLHESLVRFDGSSEVCTWWTLEDGKCSVGDSTMLLGAGFGLLSMPKHCPPAGIGLRDLLQGVRIVRAGVPFPAPRSLPRLVAWRAVANPARPDEAPSLDTEWHATNDGRIGALMCKLVAWSEEENPCFAAVQEFTSRLGLPGPLRVETHESGGQKVAFCSFGAHDVATLSDGTMRLLEIAHFVVDPDVSVLVLDEPETNLHPGILRRLLAEIEAASAFKQVLLATHSPEVVSWFEPAAIRLIQWTPTGPSIRAIDSEEMKFVGAFLDDDGSLGEYVFGGGLEE